MTEVEQKLEVGDFARNKIHGYVTFLFKDPSVFRNENPLLYFNGFNGIIVDGPDENTAEFSSFYGSVGTIRLEVNNELEKVLGTQQRIILAKGFLNNLNSESYPQIDNLTYIDLLYKLNEQEKELLKNDPAA